MLLENVPSRTDVLTREQRRRNMSAVRSRHTTPELRLRRALHANGLRYRLHAKLPGKPDLVFPRARLAVLVDGCFWHGCPLHATYPKTRAEWWAAKLARNRERDAEVNAQLAALGWNVLRVWEHEVKGGTHGDLREILTRVQAAVKPKRHS